MAKAKTNRPNHYEKKVAVKEGVTFDQLIKVAVKAPKKEQQKVKK